MTGPITNHSGLADGKSPSATGSKVDRPKLSQSSTAEAGSGASLDQVSLSSTGRQLTGQAGHNPIVNADEAFAMAAKIKSLFNESGAGALAAHGGKTAADLRGLLHSS